MGKQRRLKVAEVRRLVFVLGDQLDESSSALDEFDPETDIIFMAEVAQESTKVVSHKARTVLFLSAMRHFRDSLRSAGKRVEYLELDAPDNPGTLEGALELAVKRFNPALVLWVEPGEYGVKRAVGSKVRELGVPFTETIDRHFLTTVEEFRAFAKGRKMLRLEHFYRPARARFKILMDGDEPAGGEWNYDTDNRGSFGKQGPGLLPAPRAFIPDTITRDVIALVERKFPNHPGDLSKFDWPVTSAEAELALEDFIENRLSEFGQYQDAIWMGQPWLYHSRLASSMNLKLLDPRKVLKRAEAAYRAGKAPLASVEGFIRQILGWREYVRGVYWLHMPGYIERNHLAATLPLPAIYWTGKTEMSCLSDAIDQTLKLGYAHHIQRLMVTGLFAMLLGVNPKFVHEWYLAVYVDAVEWVELPNTLGMSQYADGGIMASKPYAATGKYIERMSNACKSCKYKPGLAVGPLACPFTTLYWDFIARHSGKLTSNPRMLMQVRNLERKGPDEVKEIRAAATRFRLKLVGEDLAV